MIPPHALQNVSPAPPSAVRRFLRYVRPYLWLLVGATVAGIFKFTLPAAFAIALRYMTDRLVPQFGAALQPSDPVFALTERYLAGVAGILPAQWQAGTPWANSTSSSRRCWWYAAWAVAMYYRTSWAQVAGHRAMLDLRTDLFQHVQRLSHGFYQSRQSGGIVSRLTADIAMAQNFIGAAMNNIWMDVATCVFYLALLLAMDVELTLVALAVFPLGILHAGVRAAVQAHLEGGAGSMGRVLGRPAGARGRACAGQELRVRAARGAYFFGCAQPLWPGDGQRQGHQPVQHDGAVAHRDGHPGADLVRGYRIFHGQSTIGEVIAFIHLLRQLYFPVNRISEMNSVLHNSLAAIERIFEVFDTPAAVAERPGARRLPRLAGEIWFDHVEFGYGPERSPTLAGIDLRIKPGEVVALVGLSGRARARWSS